MSSLEEVLNDLRIPFRKLGEHHHTTFGRISVDCPFCSKDSNHFRLGIRINGRGASCWKCGSKPISEVLAELSGQPLNRIYELTKGFLDSSPSFSKIEDKRGRLVLPPNVKNMEKIHRKYLKGRGFDPDYLEQKYGVKGIGLSERLPWRLFIPITHQEKMVSWTTRSISDDVEKRYLNAKPEEEILSPKKILFGEDDCHPGKVVVVEGPMDLFRIGPGAVALMGLVYTSQQMRLIARYAVRTIVLDQDASEQSKRLCDDLSTFPGVTQRATLEAKDPGSASQKEVEQIRRLFL